MTRAAVLIATAACLLLLPMTASAQLSDAAYCEALVKKYDQFLNMRGVRQPQSLESRVGAEKCRAGDPAGIAPLEKALTAAKLDLPPRN